MHFGFGSVVQWLTRLPVTQKIEGSSPFGTAIFYLYGSVAQSVEHRTENPGVDSSILSGATTFLKKVVNALVAQLDRVFGYEPKGWGFDSSRVHQMVPKGDVYRQEENVHVITVIVHIQTRILVLYASVPFKYYATHICVVQCAFPCL